MVFHTAPPQPASNARITCPAVFVGGPDDSQNGFGDRMPAKFTARSGFCSNIESLLQIGLWLYQIAIQVGPPVAEELPRLPHFGNHVEIQFGGQHFILVARSLGDSLPARIAEVALPIELADVPRSLAPHAINRAHKVAVRDRVRRLLQLPKVFAQTRNGGRRIKDDLRAIQPQRPRAFGKVPVIAGVNADLAEAEIKHRISQVAGPEVKLLPEARLQMRNVCLAVLAQVRAFAVNHRRRVVVETLGLNL